MSSFKILHVIPNLAKGGAQRLVISIAKAYLSQEKYQVKILVFSSVNDFEEDTKKLDITIIPLSYQSKFPLRLKVNNEDKYIKFLSEYNPDVIHSHLKAGDLISRIQINGGYLGCWGPFLSPLKPFIEHQRGSVLSL